MAVAILLLLFIVWPCRGLPAANGTCRSGRGGSTPRRRSCSFALVFYLNDLYQVADSFLQGFLLPKTIPPHHPFFRVGVGVTVARPIHIQIVFYFCKLIPRKSLVIGAPLASLPDHREGYVGVVKPAVAPLAISPAEGDLHQYAVTRQPFYFLGAISDRVKDLFYCHQVIAHSFQKRAVPLPHITALPGRFGLQADGPGFIVLWLR